MSVRGDSDLHKNMLYQLSVENQKDILAAGGYALVYGGQILIAGSAEIATAGRVALEGCKTNPALCLNNVGIFVADAVAPEAAVGPAFWLLAR